MHQGIGLEAFNALPKQKAVHALYECCYSVIWPVTWPAAARTPTTTPCSGVQIRCCSACPSPPVDRILEAYPHIGRRPRSARSQAEQCSVWDERP